MSGPLETYDAPSIKEDFVAETGAVLDPEIAQIINYSYTPEEEKRVVRKLDLHVLSYLCSLYLLSFLDRGNIGNANTAGMSDDLGITDAQYQWFLTIFYISYICFEPMIMLWKVFPPRWYAPTVVICWGIFSTCNAAVTNWSGMMALRFLLGIAEAAYSPGVPFYLHYFYYRRELNFRIGLFVSVAPLASAFSGALAYGITYHKHAIESWRILFIVEGIPTVLVGLLGYYAIPNSPKECRFLTEHEKNIAIARTVRQSGHAEKSSKIDWAETAKALIDPKNIINALMYFSLNVSFSSLPVFLPTILSGMGYTSINAQGLSAPPYIVAFICVLVLSWYSDRILQRGLLLTICALIGAAGYLILAIAHNTGARYFAVYLAACGMFPCIGLLLTWVGNNQGNDTRRGVGYALLNVVGQCGPLLGTRLFPESEGPYYHKGFYITFAFLVLVAVLAQTQRFYLRYLNKKLDETYGFIDRAEALNATDEAAGPETFRYVM